MNPYLAKLHSLNFGKTVPRATDETDKTSGEFGYVGFVGAEGCGVAKIDVRIGVLPDTPPHSENVTPLATKICTAQARSDAEEEHVAIIGYDGGATRSWAEALARLDPVCPPYDVPPKRWVQVIDDCGRFIDSGWASKAEALGWGPFDLFGCDRRRPFSRVDRAGLLWLLNGRKLVALTADTATIETQFGSRQTYRRHSVEVVHLALAWELEEAFPRREKNSG